MKKPHQGARFIWARNRSAAGRGADPMPQIIHDDVGISHLEIVASIPLTGTYERTIDDLVALYPPPEVERL